MAVKVGNATTKANRNGHWAAGGGEDAGGWIADVRRGVWEVSFRLSPETGPTAIPPARVPPSFAEFGLRTRSAAGKLTTFVA